MSFTRVRWRTAAVLFFAATGVPAAQQGFPLRQGEWESKSEVMGQPLTMLICMTDATWKKGLTQTDVCTVQEFSVTSKGMHYIVDCPMKSMQMKGPVDLTFDGMEHMTGKASMAVTIGGKTTTSQSVTDYRWKGAACSSADVNMRPKPAH